MLNDLNRIKKFDTGSVADSIEALPLQIRQVLADLKTIKIPKSYSNVTQVVVHGMGGSNLGVRIIKTVFADELKVPITITAGYQVPAHVNKQTLFVLSSYSGTTEEVLSVFDEIKKRGAKIMAIVEHGKSPLIKLITKHKIPAFIFKSSANPSNQPRLGLGYSIFGMLALFSKAGLIKLDAKEAIAIVAQLEEWGRGLVTPVPSKDNPAKAFAEQIKDKQPILVGAEFLYGNLHAFRNQICENSKNFASYLAIPELNHYAMEGLTNPGTNKKDLVFFFVESDFYHPRVQKRFQLTKEIVKKNGIKVIDHKLAGETKIEQAFELLQLGSWISFYLGILNQVNPVEIKWVDWFKKKLAE